MGDFQPEIGSYSCFNNPFLHVCLRGSLKPGPSPRFPAGRPKTRRGATFFKYNIGCMQQPGGQTWNGGHRFQMEGWAPPALHLDTTVPATALT